MSSKQVSLSDDFGSEKNIEQRETVKEQRKFASHGVCALLDRMTIEEFDAVVAGELDSSELYEKYQVKR